MEYPEITNKIITLDEAIDAIKSYQKYDEENLDIQIEFALYKGTNKYLREKKFEAIIELFIQALNEGWIPDWSNSQEYKYYPWFYMSSNPEMSSSGLSYDGYGAQLTFSDVGSRLCVKNEKLAMYVAKKYSSWYGMFMAPTI